LLLRSAEGKPFYASISHIYARRSLGSVGGVGLFLC